jgi:hypothetical protein
MINLFPKEGWEVCFASRRMNDPFFFFLIILKKHSGLHLLKHAGISGINYTWSWWMILFSFLLFC